MTGPLAFLITLVALVAFVVAIVVRRHAVALIAAGLALLTFRTVVELWPGG